ncbi:MAG: hypothetical protein KC416_15360 [Myxococcales bacterium]|nr:hypothetical protein [Myxococcales bacterium]
MLGSINLFPALAVIAGSVVLLVLFRIADGVLALRVTKRTERALRLET